MLFIKYAAFHLQQLNSRKNEEALNSVKKEEEKKEDKNEEDVKEDGEKKEENDNKNLEAEEAKKIVEIITEGHNKAERECFSFLNLLNI